MKQLLTGKLIFTIERSAANFTGEINLHPVLNRAVKRISSHADPEPAARLKVPELSLDRVRWDGPQDQGGSTVVSSRTGAKLPSEFLERGDAGRVAFASGGGGRVTRRARS